VTPGLSVILPLGDHRGLAERSASGWARQTLADDRYEIVAVADGHHPRLAARVRGLLRPHDQLIVIPRAREIELYQAGAQAAGGDVLLFTESHCLPEPEAVEAVERSFSSPGVVAGCLRAGNIRRSRLSRMEELMTRQEEAVRGGAGRWANVSLRGFAVRAETFRRLGGFRAELERFAETAFAIELERSGGCIGDIPDAVVQHGDCATVSELEPALLALGRGRRAFVEGGPREVVERYLGAPAGIERMALERRPALALSYVIARALLSGNRSGTRSSLARSLVRLAPAALGGSRGVLVAARTRARLALLRSLRPGGEPESRLPRFAAAWRALVRCGELQQLARRPLPPLPPLDPLPLFSPGEMDDAHFLGFHAREADDRGPFRWSGPVGLLRLPLAVGDYEGRLTASSAPGERPFALFFNGRRVRFEVEPGETLRFTFPLERRAFNADGEQHLSIVCAPFVPRDAGLSDPRALGLAFRTLLLVPLSERGADRP
jgi:Glycosyl transferase family 2